MSDAQIKKQVEFYFSDANMRKDVWLKAAVAEDAEGFIPISILTTFNKLKEMTTDESKIAAALNGSTMVVVSEDGTRIRRATKLDPTDTSPPRTLYVKGFPTDDKDVNIESIEKQFSEYGNVLRVGLRKDFTSKTFKGGAFIEYDSEEAVVRACAAAHKAAETEGGKPTVIIGFKGKIFDCVMPYPEWLHNHTAKLAKLKQAIADKKANKKEGGSAKGGADASGDKRKRESDDSEGGATKALKVEFVPGTVIKVCNIPSDATLMQLKDAFKAAGNLKYVEYENGSGQGFARFDDPENALKVLELLSKDKDKKSDSIRLEDIFGEIVTGEEEVAYWTKIALGSSNKPKSGKGGRGGGKFGGRGGGRGGGGRGGRGGFRGKR
jgi:lupus La protein